MTFWEWDGIDGNLTRKIIDMTRKIKMMIGLIIGMTECYGQSSIVTPYFSAVVVSNIEVSTKWYQSVFDLKAKNQMNDENAGYKLMILESSAMLLELLELRGSLVRKALVEGKSEGTEIQGHFKIGFNVSNMDDWLKHLSNLKIDVPQVWTDQTTKKRNFLINDPDGNLIQFFEAI